MSHNRIPRRRLTTLPSLIALTAILVAASLGLAACGGSSSTTTTTQTAANATGTTTAGTSTGTSSAGKTTPRPLAGTTPGARAARLRKRGKGFKNALPRFHAVLVRFAACLRQNGANVGEPNTSGKGPIFDTKEIKTPKFQAAMKSCRGTLLSALRANRPRPGTAGKVKSAG